MTHRAEYHGAAVLLGREAEIAERCCEIAAATMEDYGHPVERSGVSGYRRGQVVSSHHLMQIFLTPAQEPAERDDRTLRIGAKDPATRRQWRVRFTLIPADAPGDDAEISELLMAVILYRISETCEIRLIEWMDPLTLLTPEQFYHAFACMAEDAAPHATRVAPPETDELSRHYQHRKAPGTRPLRTSPALAGRVQTSAMPNLPVDTGADDAEEDERPSDVQRLAVWGMTGMIWFMSGPVALSVAAVNLIKGEDLRLNTHVLALTMSIVTLTRSGALDRVMNHIVY